MQITSNVTAVTNEVRSVSFGLVTDYRVPSLKRTSCCNYFSSSNVVSPAFSALCVYSKFRHHPHPVGYTFVPNFVSFAASVAELIHGEKSRTQSLSHPAYLMPRELTFSSVIFILYCGTVHGFQVFIGL